MISKTHGQKTPPAPSEATPAVLPLHRQPSEGTRETVRQLAEITRQCSGELANLGLGPAAPATASTAAAPPTLPAGALSAPARSTPRAQDHRDRLALAKMAQVRARADVQHNEMRACFTIDGPMPTVSVHYRAVHMSTQVNLAGVGAACSKGTRLYQQDVAVADWCNPRALRIAAVCDGHGVDAPGDVTPWRWLQDNLIATLRAHLAPAQAADDLTPHRVSKLLTRAIGGSRARPRHPLSVVEQMDHVNAVENGSTLTAAVRIADTVYLANVGDSRAVLVHRDGTAHQLTVDHKIDEPQEWDMVQTRVLAGDATMIQTHPGMYRMVRHARDGSAYGIAMSRSIGDDQATVSTPEISTFQVTSNDVALVLCSDGIFDTMHNDQVGQYVSDVMSLRGERAALCQRAAEGLVDWCFDTEAAREKSLANIDNLTALVLPLHEGP